MYTDFSMRGVNMNASHYYINGIPNMFNQTRSIPAYILSSVDIVSGPNTVLNGATFSNNGTNGTDAPAGLLNGTTKRAAADPVTRYTQRFSGRSTWTEDLDLGRRFGKNNEWGIRVNAHNEDGGLSIKGADVRDKSIYINLDHQDAKSMTNIFGGYYDWKVNGGQRWLSASGVTKGNLAEAPNGKTDLSFDGQTKYNHGMLFTLNHIQKFSDKWSGFINGGYGHYSEHKNDPNSGSLTLGDNGKLSDKGDVSNNLMSTQTVTKNYYAQLGINGNIKTGAVNHDVTLALDKAWHSIEGAKNMYNNGSMGSVSGNIYSGLQGNNVWYPSIETGLSSKDQYWGISLADTVKYKKAQLLLGVHKHNASVDSYNKITGRVTQTVGSDALCPTYGFVYQPDEHTSLYASHSENFDKGTIVASKYANAGEVLNPAKTKQNEIGFKYANAGFLTSLGIFNIKQANNIDVYKGSDMYLQQDGEQEYQGIELSVNGKLADKWNFMGGLMYLDATQNKTQNGTNDGKTVNGAAKWNAVAVLEYNPDEKFSIVGRAMYTGKADIYNEQLQTPSYMTYDLGVNYKTAFNKTPVTLTAMCYNLTDKNYWTAYGNNLILSSPRTLMLSATFDI